MVERVDMSRCPNCLGSLENHPENGCVLAAFIMVLRERKEHTEDQLLKLHATACPDIMWEDLGPVLNKLANGGYTLEE